MRITSLRPAAFTPGCIRRADPRDVVLFSKILENCVRAGRFIGTSSPRRLENVLDFKKCVPFFGREVPLKFVEIRGNVNTRLSRARVWEKADGVVLALAGLTRLHADPKARVELDQLMQGVRIMVLPLRENPAAPAQGALAVECRKMTRKL